MLVQKIAQLRLRPYQVNPDGQSPAGEDRPPDFRLWCFVGTYGVERDVDEHVAQPTWRLPWCPARPCPCRSRTWRRHDGAASSRGSWGILKGPSRSKSRVSVEERCGALS